MEKSNTSGGTPMEQTNKISCDTARDLLPLYVDDILSADSRALVEGHLPACPPCSEELEALRKPAEQPKFSASKGLRQSKKRLRRLVAAAASITAVIVAVVCFMGFRVFLPDRLGPGTPVPFEEGPVDMDSLYRYTATRGDTGSEADFLWLQPNRLPQFEWAGEGYAAAEDVIAIDGIRTGVAFVQISQSEIQKEYSLRKYEKDGRNDDKVGMGGLGLTLSPMTEIDKAALVYHWEMMSGEDNSGAYERASFARDLPITKVYYYNGPGENLKNDPLGWSERDGILEDCVLIWDAGTTPQGRTPPPYILAGRRVFLSTPGEEATTAVYIWDEPVENG